MLLGFVSCLVGIFYNYILGNNHLFGKIGNILNRWVELPDEIIDAGFFPKPIDRFKAWVAKPLGACIYCSTTWISIFTMFLYWMSIEEDVPAEYAFIGILTTVGMQHVWMRLWCYVKANIEKANMD